MLTFPPGYNREVMFHCKAIAAGFVIMIKAFGSNTEPKEGPSTISLPLLQSTEVLFYFHFLFEFYFHFL